MSTSPKVAQGLGGRSRRTRFRCHCEALMLGLVLQALALMLGLVLQALAYWFLGWL
jgi:hypothetical protein